MKIVFLDAATMGDVSFAPISALGELECYRTSSREESLERVKDAEILIINKILVDKELIDAAPSLRLICEAATAPEKPANSWAYNNVRNKECLKLLI